MLLVNGRLFGPLELDGQSFTAGIVAHAEELELDFGPMQFQELKRALAPWLCQMSVSPGRTRSGRRCGCEDAQAESWLRGLSPGICEPWPSFL